jgi:hypothetical protein
MLSTISTRKMFGIPGRGIDIHERKEVKDNKRGLLELNGNNCNFILFIFL